MPTIEIDETTIKALDASVEATDWADDYNDIIEEWLRADGHIS